MELKTGMFWMNDEKGQSIHESILTACDYFLAKYGAIPNLVEINPLDNPQGVLELKDEDYSLCIVNNPAILRNHLLVGVAG